MFFADDDFALDRDLLANEPKPAELAAICAAATIDRPLGTLALLDRLGREHRRALRPGKREWPKRAQRPAPAAL